MKKRNCRRQPDEKQQHEFATKIRKMTDAQLCLFVGEVKGSKSSVEEFLSRLAWMSGTGNGIGRATLAKLEKFAQTEGFITKG